MTIENPSLDSEQEEKILQAALKVFARCGKDGATFQIIAGEAGTNRSVVYYYFRSKEKLYSAVFGYVLKRYFQFIAQSIQQSPDFKTMLKTFIERYIDTVGGNPHLVQFMVGELTRNPDDVYEQIREKVADLPNNPFIAFTSNMQRAIDNGEIRAADPMHTFISVLGACLMAFIMYPIGRAVIPEIRDNFPAVIEQRKQHVFDLVYNGLRP